MFPNAKFIYLMRNPYTVFESTPSFFTNTIKPLEFRHISDEEMEKNILLTYTKLYRAYEEQKKYVPEGNLFEVKFEDFEADAFGTTKLAYEKLGIREFHCAELPYADIQTGRKATKRTNMSISPYHSVGE